MEEKIWYEFIRDTKPNLLGKFIISYVEKLKSENEEMKKKLNKQNEV